MTDDGTLPNGLPQTIEMLGDSRSARRRLAAKRLRKSGCHEAGDALTSALDKEILDARTWETQYQMIMALASCGTKAAVPLIERVLQMPLEPMVHLAAGDALVRLNDDVDAAVREALRSGMQSRVEGASRALTMIDATPSPATIDELVEYASSPAQGPTRFWVAAAAAKWPRAHTQAFLERAVHDEREETRRAAEASLQGRSLKWHPL